MRWMWHCTGCAGNSRPSVPRSRSSMPEDTAMHFEKPRSGPSLARQLLATYFVASLLSVGLMAGILASILTWNMDDVIQHGLDKQANWIERRLEFDAAGTLVALQKTPDRRWVYDAAPEDLKYRVVDAHGVVA